MFEQCIPRIPEQTCWLLCLPDMLRVCTVAWSCWKCFKMCNFFHRRGLLETSTTPDSDIKILLITRLLAPVATRARRNPASGIVGGNWTLSVAQPMSTVWDLRFSRWWHCGLLGCDSVCSPIRPHWALSQLKYYHSSGTLTVYTHT
jgi:hypothetical protein